MTIIGYILVLLVGIVLGLVGGGGSILTVPLVNYFFGVDMLLATTYSLFVVAVASGIGVLQRLNANQVDFRKALIFVVPSMLVAFSIRLWIMPLFPVEFPVASFQLSRDITITFLLVLVMLYTAGKTLTGGKKKRSNAEATVFSIVLFGVLTGMLSGFIGAGGGFIIVPILLRMGLDMKKSVGTSMLIITIQSFVALLGDFLNPEIMESPKFNWVVLLTITAITVVGVFLGTLFQKKVDGPMLRKLFSWLLVFVAVGLIFKMIFN